MHGGILGVIQMASQALALLKTTVLSNSMSPVKNHHYMNMNMNMNQTNHYMNMKVMAPDLQRSS